MQEQRARRSGADDGDLHPAERARVEPECAEPAEEHIHPGGTREAEPLISAEAPYGAVELRARVYRHGLDARVLEHVGPERPQARAERARASPRAGDDYAPAPQRQPVEPSEPLRQGADLADYDDGGAVYAHRSGFFRKRAQSRETAALRRRRAALDHGGRGFRRHASPEQPLDYPRHCAHAHEEHHGAPGAAQRIEIDLQRLARAGMSRDYVQRRTAVAVRHRYAGVCRGGDCRRDARDDLELDAALAELFELLSTAPEHERVAALQADDVFALERFLARPRYPTW